MTMSLSLNQETVTNRQGAAKLKRQMQDKAREMDLTVDGKSSVSERKMKLMEKEMRSLKTHLILIFPEKIRLEIRLCLVSI